SAVHPNQGRSAPADQCSRGNRRQSDQQRGNSLLPSLQYGLAYETLSAKKPRSDPSGTARVRSPYKAPLMDHKNPSAGLLSVSNTSPRRSVISTRGSPLETSLPGATRGQARPATFAASEPQ